MADTRKKIVYGGFTGGKLDFIQCDTGWGGYGRDPIHYPLMPALFKTRQAARERYQDVRRIVIPTPIGDTD